MYGDRYKFGGMRADTKGNVEVHIWDKKEKKLYVSLHLYNTKVTRPDEVPAFVRILTLLNDLPEEMDDD